MLECARKLIAEMHFSTISELMVVLESAWIAALLSDRKIKLRLVHAFEER